MKAGYGKAGKQKTLSNFPTATTTTNYNYLWDTDSEGKVRLPRQFHLIEASPGCSQDKSELAISGKIVASRPRTGPIPKLINLNQNSGPNFPGSVLVTWLRVSAAHD